MHTWNIYRIKFLVQYSSLLFAILIITVNVYLYNYGFKIQQNIKQDDHDRNIIFSNVSQENYGSYLSSKPAVPTWASKYDNPVWEMLKKIREKDAYFFPSNFELTTLQNLTLTLGSSNRKNAAYLLETHEKSQGWEPNWLKFHKNIRQFSMYDSDDPAIGDLLHDISELKIIAASEKEGGTQMKFLVKLSDNGLALIKPMRFGKEGLYSKNGTKLFHVSELLYERFERYYAEIASFHLDRILGFNRVPPAAGRLLNLTELKPLLPEKTANTYFVTEDNRTCLIGTCVYFFCSRQYPVCGNKDTVEVAVIAYLPEGQLFRHRKPWRPFYRTYRTNEKEEWEGKDYCKTDRRLEILYPVMYKIQKHWLDLMDMHIFDFLTGDRDRHSFTLLHTFRYRVSFPVLYDNGRGFGDPSYDDMLILVPVVECCNIRKSTFLKLVKLYTGKERLSYLMRRSLWDDPLTPVLTETQLQALDRRVEIILKVLSNCLQRKQINEVIVDDNF